MRAKAGAGAARVAGVEVDEDTVLPERKLGEDVITSSITALKQADEVQRAQYVKCDADIAN
ncbi:unnamed protein product, partial [Gongylonema pulchrum]|uniref:Uncharacterized protein n=1 Tax=Gongylonema pulchrum TaxID=637853 RepID=A0A183EAF7_9BILA